jgi:acyl-CoA thioester hydrolase
MPKHPIEQRSAFRYFTPIQVRWGDLDPFNHVNNVLYYRYFELAIVTFLATEGGLDLTGSPPVVSFAAESRCIFNKAIDLSGFGPQGVMVDGAVRVERLGSSSVTWGLAIFRQGEDEAAAQGSWTHVFVDPQTTRPTPIPDDLRAALERYTA